MFSRFGFQAVIPSPVSVSDSKYKVFRNIFKEFEIFKPVSFFIAAAAIIQTGTQI
jgi:hypothetical protein